MMCKLITNWSPLDSLLSVENANAMFEQLLGLPVFCHLTGLRMGVVSFPLKVSLCISLDVAKSSQIPMGFIPGILDFCKYTIFHFCISPSCISWSISRVRIHSRFFISPIHFPKYDLLIQCCAPKDLYAHSIVHRETSLALGRADPALYKVSLFSIYFYLVI